MLDIKLFRENPDFIKENLKRRGKDELLKRVDEIVKLDSKLRKLIHDNEKLREKKNKLTKEISQNRSKEKIEEVKKLNAKIKDYDEKMKKLKDKLEYNLLRIPNLLDESVPKGKDDSENVQIKMFGSKPNFNFKARSHQELCELNDWYDIKRAAKTSGARFYFLKGDLARLHVALINYAIDFITKKGFTFMIVPDLVKNRFFYGTGWLPFENREIYKVENDDLNLIGTAEVPLMGYHADETLLESQLPMKYSGYSACFRTEAGSHGKDTKGIFRVHQFEKVEMVILSKPEESWKMFEYLQNTAEEFWKSIGIPFRVVNICTGDIGSVASKKYDIEAWLPGQQKFRELGSCSNTLDFQARRLNIKYREEEGKPPKGYVHSLNNTLVASPRAVIAIIENFQTKDGHVKIPKVLQKYMGKDMI